MRLLFIMIKKELLEMTRNYKLLSVPILFMIIGALQPITFYYMPDILKMATLPEGAILQIPLPSPAETIFSMFGEINQIGILVLVLISMGAIANEVKSGVTETILVKPIPFRHYLLSKWVSYFGLTILGAILGILFGYFYTTQLIGELSFILLIKSSLVFMLYLLFLVGFTLFLSSIVQSSILAGGGAIFVAIILSIISNLPFNLWFLPGYLLKINKSILFQTTLDYSIWGILITLVYILLLFIGSVALFKRKSKALN